MESQIDVLFLRRPAIDYISPPVCEIIFSASGGPVIILNPLTPQSYPTGLILGGVGGFTLSWDAYPGALCYSIYRSVNADDAFGEYVLVAECFPDPVFDLTGFPDGYYRVTAITTDGETPLSLPIRKTAGGGGGNFFQLNWTTLDRYDGSPAGTVGETLTDAEFDISLSHPGVPVFPTNMFIQEQGQMFYTGPQRNCHLHLVVSAVQQPLTNNLSIWVDAVEVLHIDTPDVAAPGTYDFDFIVPASVNADIHVDVFMEIFMITLNAPGSIHWVGTLTEN